jgi:recombination protein RecR
MAKFASKKLNDLIDALKMLPSIGPKSAQRIAFQLLQHEKDVAVHLSEKLKDAVEGLKSCNTCRMFADEESCSICQDENRDLQKICIVESPIDVVSMEKSNAYNGKYFILMGHLSPIDGIGPDEIGIPLLESLLAQGQFEEMIVATSMTVEGDATAHMLSVLARKYAISPTRLALGLPVGSELEYIDQNTLSRAILGRNSIEEG